MCVVGSPGPKEGRALLMVQLFYTSYHRNILSTLKSKGIVFRLKENDSKNFSYVSLKDFCEHNGIFAYESETHIIYSKTKIEAAFVVTIKR